MYQNLQDGVSTILQNVRTFIYSCVPVHSRVCVEALSVSVQTYISAPTHRTVPVHINTSVSHFITAHKHRTPRHTKSRRSSTAHPATKQITPPYVLQRPQQPGTGRCLETRTSGTSPKFSVTCSVAIILFTVRSCWPTPSTPKLKTAVVRSSTTPDPQVHTYLAEGRLLHPRPADL